MTLVMIVDDDEDVAFMVVNALRLVGLEATSWTRDFDALLTAEPWIGVDVAIVDLHLGGRFGNSLDGGHILAYLGDAYPAMRRILFSGSAPETLPGGLRLPGLCDQIVLKGDLDLLLEAVHG